MKSIIKMAVAACVFLALGLGIFWILSQSGPKLAFADVADAFQNIETAICKFTEVLPEVPDAPGEVNIVTGNIMFLAPSRERIEMEGHVCIVDCQEGKILSWGPSTNKTAIWQNIPKKYRSRLNTFLELRKTVLDAQRGQEDVKVEPLGRKTIDGRTVIGFLLRQDLADTKIWADPKTALPVRVEVTVREPALHIVMTDFETGMELDESLFSLEAPKGYTTQDWSREP